MELQTSKPNQAIVPSPTTAGVHKKEKYHPPEISLLVGVIGCVGGLFVQLVIGALYQWGIINLYVTSYYKMSDSSLTVQSTAVAFPIMFLMIGLTMRVGLYLSSITHPLIVLSGCQILEALSMFIASYMPNVWLFILFYGITFGLCAGMNFMIPMYECNKYLVGRKMIVNGIILVGTGAGALVFGLFSYSYLNPNELSPLNGYYFNDPALQQIAAKCPTLMKWLSLLYLGIGFTGVAMISPVCIRNRRLQNQNERHRQQKHEEKERLKQQHKQEKIKHRLEHQKSQQHSNHEKSQQGENNDHSEAHDQNEDHKAKNQPQPNQFHGQRHLKLPKIQAKGSKPRKNSSNQQPQQNPNLSQVHILQQPNPNSQQQNSTSNAVATSTTPPPHEKHLTKHQRRHMREAHSIGEALKSRVFWVSALILLLGATGCFMINGNYKTYVKTKIKDDKFLTIVGVIGAVGNGGSRILWNLLFMKSGYKSVLLTVLTLSIAVFATIRFSTDNKAAYLVEVFLINCCLGGFLVSTPTSLLSIYGPTTGANIYGIFWENFGIANMLGYIFVSQLSKSIGGFDSVIYVCLGMSCIAIPIVIFTKFQGPWENDTSQLEYCVSIENQKKEQANKLHQNQGRSASNNENHHKKRKGSSDSRNHKVHNQVQETMQIELKMSNTKTDKFQDTFNQTMEQLTPMVQKYKEVSQLRQEDKIAEQED